MTTLFAVGTALAAGPHSPHCAITPPPRPPGPLPSPPFYLGPTEASCVGIASSFPSVACSSPPSAACSCLGREAVSSSPSLLLFGKVSHSHSDAGDHPSSSSCCSSSSSRVDSSSPPCSSAGVVASSLSSSRKATRFHHHLHSLSSHFVDRTDLSRSSLRGGGGGGGGEIVGGEEEKWGKRRRAMRIVIPMSRKSDREANGASPRDSTSSSSSLASLSPSSASSAAALNSYHSSPRSDVMARFATDDGVSSLGLFVANEDMVMFRRSCREDNDHRMDEAVVGSSSSPWMSNDGREGGGGPFAAAAAAPPRHSSIFAVDGALIADAPSGPVICNNRGCRPIGNDVYRTFERDRGDEWIRRRDAAVHLPHRLAALRARTERCQDKRGGEGGSANDIIGGSRRRQSGGGSSGRGGGGSSTSVITSSPGRSFYGEFAQFCDELYEDEIADKWYREAVAAAPTDWKLLTDYATFAYRRLKDNVKAENLFNRALEESPDCAELLASYALFLWQLES